MHFIDRLRQWLRNFMRGAALVALLSISCSSAPAEQVAVRYTEGLVHGFLVLRTMGGDTIAGGDLSQVFSKGRVTNRLTFHFKDGSIHEESTVYSQKRQFRLLNYHLVQKGPSFPIPIDVSIDRNQATVRYTDDDGKQKVETEQKLPADVANGLVFTLVKNIAPGSPETVVSMVGTTPKPLLVKLKITPVGKEPFSAAGVDYDATHYLVKVDIGGIKGVLATLLGKNPPDHHVWVVDGETPGFVKAEGPLYLGGPAWRIELASAAEKKGESRQGPAKGN